MSHFSDVAWQDFTQGKYRAALSKFEALVNTKAENAQVHIGIACCYGMLNQSEYAIKEASRALELDPSLADPHVILADAHRQMRNYNESEKEIQKALELDFDSAHAHQMLGLLLLDKKQFQKAVEHFEKGIAVEPGNSSYHINLAIAYQKMGHDMAAVKEYRYALEFSRSFMTVANVILSFVGHYRWALTILLLSLFVIRSIYTLPLMLIAVCYIALSAWFYLRRGEYLRGVGFAVSLFVVVAFYIYHLRYGL